MPVEFPGLKSIRVSFCHLTNRVKNKHNELLESKYYYVMFVVVLKELTMKRKIILFNTYFKVFRFVALLVGYFSLFSTYNNVHANIAKYASIYIILLRKI